MMPEKRVHESVVPVRRHCPFDLIIVALFIFSCQGVERPIKGGSLHIPIGRNVYGLDPIHDAYFLVSAQVLGLVYSPLYAGEGAPASVAREVFPDSAHQVWTIRLKEGIRFHDDPCFPDGKGEEVTAEDVQFSLRWLWSQRGEHHKEVRQMKKIGVVDRYEVRVTLEAPNASFPADVSGPYFKVVSKRAGEFYGSDLRFHPVGSGPFQLASLEPGRIVLIRNPNYWIEDEFGQELPYLDKIILSYVPDPLTRYRRLLAGDFDLVLFDRFDAPPVVEFSRTDFSSILADSVRERGIQLVEGNLLMFLLCMLSPDLRRSPLLTQAMNWAIDRERILTRGYCSNCVPALNPAFPPSPDVPEYGYDPEKAVRLLAQAGYPEGEGLPTFLISTHAAVLQIVEELRKDLKAIGIQTELLVQSRNEAQRGPRTWQMEMVPAVAAKDPHDRLWPFRSGMWMALNDATFDSLWDAARGMETSEERVRMIRRMQRMVMEKPPLIFLFWSKFLFVAGEHVMNISPGLLGVSARTWLRAH